MLLLYISLVYTCCLELFIMKELSIIMVLLTILSSMVYTHPYWSLAGSLVLVFTTLVIMAIEKFFTFGKCCSHENLKVLFLVAFTVLGTSTQWILYYAYEAKELLAIMVRNFLTMGQREILGERLIIPWLETVNVKALFFKVHPLEP